MDHLPARMPTTARRVPETAPKGKTPTRGANKRQPTFYTRPDGIIVPIMVISKATGAKTAGYRHCIYVLPMPDYSELERRQLATFIQEQDRIRTAKSPVIGGFPSFIGRILKHKENSSGYAKGFRWRYNTGRGESFRSIDCTTLDQLMKALAAAPM